MRSPIWTVLLAMVLPSSMGLWGQVSPRHPPASLCLCFPALTTDVIHQSLFMSALSSLSCHLSLTSCHPISPTVLISHQYTQPVGAISVICLYSSPTSLPL